MLNIVSLVRRLPRCHKSLTSGYVKHQTVYFVIFFTLDQIFIDTKKKFFCVREVYDVL